jgi:hypothetical protein
MKKLLSSILAIFIAIIPMGITAFALDTSAKNPTIETVVDKDTVEVGDVITLTAKLPSNSKLCVLTYQLTYNPNNLSVINKSEKLNSVFPTEMISYKTAGMVRYGGITSDYVSDESKVLFTIQFEVLKLPCTIDVNILEAYEDDGDNPEIDVTYEYNKYSSKQIKFDGITDIPDIPDIPDVPVYQYFIDIKEPNDTTVKYKKSTILYVELSEGIPEGGRIEWIADNDNFETETLNNGSELKIKSINKGDTIFTVTLYDANGNELASDSVEMYSKAGFFDKVVWFFENFFNWD